MTFQLPIQNQQFSYVTDLDLNELFYLAINKEKALYFKFWHLFLDKQWNKLNKQLSISDALASKLKEQII